MKQTVRNVAIYLAIFSVFCGLLFGWMRWRVANFELAYVDAVTENQPGYQVEDPCLKRMAADTEYGSWAKVRIECEPGKFTVSTLDARVFEDEQVTPRAALELAGNINHYSVRFDGDEVVALGELMADELYYWHCDTGDPMATVVWDQPFAFEVFTLNCVYELRNS